MLSFVTAALLTDWTAQHRGSGAREGQVADLRQFLLRGFASLPTPSRGGFNAALLRKINGQTNYTAEDLAEIERAKELKLQKLAQFAR